VPWVFVFTYLVGAGFEFAWPFRIRARADPNVTLTCGAAIFVVGAIIAGSGLLAFRRAQTTTVPGQLSSQLVTWGSYRVSRNPMYVGLIIAYLGEAMILRQIWPVVVLPVVLAYVNWVVIPVEEFKLEEAFGEAYTRYRERVRRWV
jgi:protein-S-isoprenylcysteine O-methyltransferase Ste14